MTNADIVLHPWLQGEVLQLLDGLPEVPVHGPGVLGGCAVADLAGPRATLALAATPTDPHLDNLAGHLSWSIVKWLFAHGVMPLYTPMSGSWLNMAESVQRILLGRALSGQHPTTAVEVITWLEETVAGCAAPTHPLSGTASGFGATRPARQRRLGGSAATLADHQLIAG